MKRTRGGIVGVMAGCFTGVAVAIIFAGGSRDESAKQGSATAQQEKLDQPNASKSKWVALFNGENLDGWITFPGQPSDGAKVWMIRDGVLICEGSPVGYIRTTKDFTNFELELEWRFDPKLGAGNSGVLLRLVGPDQVWPKSIEAQLESRSAGDIWNIGEFPMKAEPTRTDGRRTAKANPTNEKPLGEWNKYAILLDHGRLELRVNGELQNVAQDCEVVAGKLGLQSEGAHIEFRNIRIRTLPE